MELDITAVTTKLCRVCMIADAEHLTNLHDTSCGQPSLHEMLEAICAPVFAKSDVDAIIPGLPTKICPPCRNAIVAAYNLHQQCIETDRRLGELLALKWELQGPGGEDACGNLNEGKALKEEPRDETLNADMDNEMDQDEVCDVGDIEMSSHIEESSPEKVMNEESKQYAPLNKSATKKKKNSASKSDISCSVCDKVFLSRDSLNRHIKQNWCDGTNDPKKRTCDICKKVLKSVRLMEVHRQMHDTANVAQPYASSQHPEVLLEGVNSETVYIKQEQDTQVPEIKSEPDEEDLLAERNQALGDENGMNVSFGGLQPADRNLTNNSGAVKEAAIASRPMSSIATVKFVKGILASQIAQRTSCKLCSDTFANSAALRKHVGTKHQIYECGYCKNVYPSLFKLDSHQRENHSGHSEKSRGSICTKCKMTFKSMNALRLHLKICAPKRKTFPCKSCDTSFSSAASLKDHKRHCAPKRKNFPCESCDESFSSAASLLDHKRHCSSDSARTCKFCNIIFETFSLYKTHCQETHAGPVDCPECGRTLANLTVYSMHIRRNICKRDNIKPDMG